MTIEDHTSKTQTGSRANRDSPCDTGTPPFPLPPTATVGFRGSDRTWRAMLDATAVEQCVPPVSLGQCVPSISLDTTGLDCATTQWTYFLVKKHEVRGKGLKHGKPLFREIPPLPRMLGSFERAEPKWAATHAQLHDRRTMRLQEERTQNKGSDAHTRPGQRLRMNPSGSLCHSAVERTIVSRTPFRQEGKLNGSNGQENWRHFPRRSRWRLEVIFSCMFSKLWVESITFRERHPFQHLL